MLDSTLGICPNSMHLLPSVQLGVAQSLILPRKGTEGSKVNSERKERRGFASMSPEKQREIASKGGRAAHQKGTAHEWTADEARSAGRKGGQVSRGGRGRLIVPPEMPAGREERRLREPGAGRRREPAVSGSSARVVPFGRPQTQALLEATDHGKTRSRGLGAHAGHRRRRERSERIFRNIHGTESRPARARRLRRRRPDRPRPPSSATLDCGLYRPPRCFRTVSGR